MRERERARKKRKIKYYCCSVYFFCCCCCLFILHYCFDINNWYKHARDERQTYTNYGAINNNNRWCIVQGGGEVIIKQSTAAVSLYLDDRPTDLLGVPIDERGQSLRSDPNFSRGSVIAYTAEQHGKINNANQGGDHWRALMWIVEDYCPSGAAVAILYYVSRVIKGVRSSGEN